VQDEQLQAQRAAFLQQAREIHERAVVAGRDLRTAEQQEFDGLMHAAAALQTIIEAAPVAMFKPGDTELLRLFDTNLRDKVVGTIQDCADGLRWSTHRLEIAISLREMVGASVDRYIRRLTESRRGFAVPECQALLTLFVIVRDTAERLDSLAAGQLSSTDARSHALELEAAWTRFIADASAYRMSADSAKRKAASEVAAKSPRPSRRDPLRESIVDLMRAYKQDDTAFKMFMSAWERNVLNDLRLKNISGENYTVCNESACKPVTNGYTLKTLKRMYSQSVKITASTR